MTGVIHNPIFSLYATKPPIIHTLLQPVWLFLTVTLIKS